MLKTIILSSLVIAFLSACNKDKETQPAVENSQQEAPQNTGNEVDSSISTSAQKNTVSNLKLALPEEKHGVNRPVSIAINGEKFLSSEKSLMPGSRVFNVQMGEYGLVKGNFVVVMKDGGQYKTAGNEAENVEKIAKDTFRITPNNSVDLMAYYKQLQQQDSYSVVEMQIDYSGQTDAAEF